MENQKARKGKGMWRDVKIMDCVKYLFEETIFETAFLVKVDTVDVEYGSYRSVFNIRS